MITNRDLALYGHQMQLERAKGDSAALRKRIEHAESEIKFLSECIVTWKEELKEKDRLAVQHAQQELFRSR